MSRYAEGTNVAVSRSQVELEQTLERFGADQFIRGWAGDNVVVGFRLDDRMVRLSLPLAPDDDRKITHTPTGRRRTSKQIAEQRDAETRRRWRSLVAIVKAKLVAIEDGISTVEREFLADVVLPDGTRFIEWAAPQIANVYDSGAMPALLPGSDDE